MRFTFNGISHSERGTDALLALCRQRLDAFREQRRGLLLSKLRCSRPWRWTPSGRKTRAVPTTS
ncbi:MAG: hypothetical protein ACKOZW_09145, partial [Cyanobium sp.]